MTKISFFFKFNSTSLVLYLRIEVISCIARVSEQKSFSQGDPISPAARSKSVKNNCVKKSNRAAGKIDMAIIRTSPWLMLNGYQRIELEGKR